MTLRHIGLFEGIGGFSLAARWMGWETIAWCEWNEFGQRVLKYHFPKAEGHGDITATDFRPYRGKCDILTGGFPCQPYSSAGKRLGKEDDRHLWPEMLRAVREVRPKWVVGENVLGIVNWNDGLVFDEVQADLEAEGYEVQPYVLPACAVNAPHRRDRTWFVAYSDGSRINRTEKYENCCENCGDRKQSNHLNDNGQIWGTSSNANGSIKQGECIRQQRARAVDGCNSNYPQSQWETFPTKPPVCGGNDGIPRKLDAITFPKWRNESIKAYGNAIVPQVALQIFKSIEKYEELCNKKQV